MRKSFYSPIPDTVLISEKINLWEEKEFAGVDLNDEGQINMLEKVFPKFQKEFNFPLNNTSIPYEYYINNGAFGR